MMLRRIFGILLLLPTLVIATDFKPWFSRDFELQPRITARYQSYPFISTPYGKKGCSADDYFFDFSIGGAALGYSVEIETIVADTPRQAPACDQVRLTARRLVLDDVGGEDPFSMAAGFTVIQAFRSSLHDISSFHHGQIEGEMHVAIGKETAWRNLWMTRWWGVLGVGIADRGSPWVRANLVWDKNMCNQSFVRLFMNTLWGLGGNNIRHTRHFSGYGGIGHQSIDLGARYTYLFESAAELSIEYAKRVHARNFPGRANLVQISFLYPFGI